MLTEEEEKCERHENRNMAFFDIDKVIYRIHVIVRVRHQLGGFGVLGGGKLCVD